MICWMKFWTTSLIRCHPSCARLGSSNVCTTTNNYSLPPHFGEVLANQSISYGNCKSTIIVMMTQLTPMMYMYYGNSTDWINGSRSPGCQILKLRAGFIYYVELGGSARKNKVRWPPAKRPQQHIDGLCIKKYTDVIFLYYQGQSISNYYRHSWSAVPLYITISTRWCFQVLSLRSRVILSLLLILNSKRSSTIVI